MNNKSLPREYNDWRTNLLGRKEDAAYTFGYHLIKHCRNEAIESLPNDMTDENRFNHKAGGCKWVTMQVNRMGGPS